MKNKWSLKKKKKKKKIFNAYKFNEWVNKQETGINKKLFKNYFSFQTPSALLKELYKTDDKEKNKLLVSVINSGLKDLKEEINKMSKEERINKKSDKIVKIVKKILKFNKRNQAGQGLKILTPS